MTNSYDVDHGLSQCPPGPLEPVELAQQPGAAPATGNTARDQEMYAAGIRTGEENAKHNAAIRGAWLPIESAPKDGTPIWAYNGEQARMRWTEGETYALWIWDDELISDVDPVPESPTHWMPMPAAPGAPASPVSTVEQEQPAAWMEPGIDIPVTNEYRNKTPLRQAKYSVPLYRHAPVAAPAAGDAIRDLIGKHAELREQNDYAYFELARTRQTGWMAWLCSHPVETHPDRKVLARGQGETPDEACREALDDFEMRTAIAAQRQGDA